MEKVLSAQLPGGQNKLLCRAIVENTLEEGWEKVLCLISAQWNIMVCKLGKEFKFMFVIQ